ncbi:hypothetical protein [Luteimonas yindakuii]|uniref:hypothetical protein n=1 Tax=Luteimonas yindakuii TaxID=2565782 RepID=UPI0010A42B53|nr:hypothetical protein [Luteimonas yindakuii]
MSTMVGVIGIHFFVGNGSFARAGALLLVMGTTGLLAPLLSITAFAQYLARGRVGARHALWGGLMLGLLGGCVWLVILGA